MTTLSLREAAKTAGTSRSTILRRIQTGQLVAPRADNGVYAINPNELLRVCPPRPDAERMPNDGAVRAPDVFARQQEIESRIRIARLEEEVTALKAAVLSAEKRSAELREERDRWHTHAEKLAAASPAPVQQLQRVRSVDKGLKLLRWIKTDSEA